MTVTDPFCLYFCCSGSDYYYWCNGVAILQVSARVVAHNPGGELAGVVHIPPRPPTFQNFDGTSQGHLDAQPPGIEHGT